MAKSVCFFDLDHTILNGISSSLWCQYMVKQGMIKDPEAFLKREKELNDIYAQGNLRLQDYMDFATEPVLSIPAATLNGMIDEFVAKEVMPRIYPQALQLFAELKAQGKTIGLISSSPDMVVNAVGRALGLAPENVIAVHLEQSNGYYQPKILGVPSYQEGKVTNVGYWYEAHPDYDPEFEFYTDSINDLPLCMAAAKAYAVNPCPKLQAQAEQHNWPILWWNKELAAQTEQA